MASPFPSKPKLWVLQWGHFPPRVLIYLKEKGIADDFDIIPLKNSANGIEPGPGQPPGTTTPILEIVAPSAEGRNDGQYIYQSLAILEYLEDLYGPDTGAPDLRGDSPEARARGRDLLAVLSEAVDFFSFYAKNASKFHAREPQDEGAARQALARVHQQLSLLERRADPVGPWLTGEGDHPMIVDCVAMASARFARDWYGVDLTEGHPRLGRMIEVFEGRESARLDEGYPEAVRGIAREMSVK